MEVRRVSVDQGGEGTGRVVGTRQTAGEGTAFPDDSGRSGGGVLLRAVAHGRTGSRGMTRF